MTDWGGTCTIRDGRPVITVAGQGEVPEWARLQAAINLGLDHAKRTQVVGMIGEWETMRRYPECWTWQERVGIRWRGVRTWLRGQMR